MAAAGTLAGLTLALVTGQPGADGRSRSVAIAGTGRWFWKLQEPGRKEAVADMPADRRSVYKKLAVFAIDDLTPDEEEELLRYLAFLRWRTRA